jgi:predicted chitinase
MFYTGIVENRSDPLQLGRCQVRIVGLHTHDKTQLPTNDLPWATPIQPVGSAAMNGIGWTPVGPVEGTTVIIMFADDSMQQPLIFGTVGGIPQAPVAISDDDSALAITEYKVKDIKLRTIVGPVSGKQLTFYDPENGSTILTTPLKANMKVIGFGLSSTCTIVSIDSPTQITISEEVTGYGENIITFGDPASNVDAVNQSKVQNVATTSSGQPLLDGSGQPVRTAQPDASATTAAPITQSNVNSSIPTIPPPKESPNAAKSSEGIKALIAACDKVGLTTKEQKCALLGIAGGETRWIPQLESYNYSVSRIKQIFSFLTDEEANRLADAQKKGMTREQFFSVIYGPTKRGKGFLGNQTDADGGKYYGRGFIQLTGKANYARYQKMANEMGLNLDLINNPDSLDSDINVSALVAALYIKDRVPKGTNPSDHPGYFYAAKKSVGVNSPDITAKKVGYYEYFYGGKATGSVDKDAGAPVPTPPPDGSSPTPGPSQDSINRGTDNTGFRDPNNKYPLPDYINEPDTNRLARGIIDGTIVEKKDSNRRMGVPLANGEGSWDQPLPSYGAKYPFNKVMETESGHVQEFDDTPGQERIHTYHRAGTYTEVDPNGSQTNYIIGENFIIMERNGFIHVGGDCNLTAEGNVNIYARTDANIQVEGNATLNVGNNLAIGVANDLDIAVGGNMQIKAAGDLHIAAANMTQKAAGIVINSTSDMNILAGGTLNADYSKGNFGNGASGADDFDLAPPAAGQPVGPVVPQLQPPDRETEELASAETPEDYSTPEGRKFSNDQSQNNGVVGAPPATASEAPVTASGGKDTKIPVDCQVIYNTTNFTNDYRMSKNFTLGMLMDGGLTGPHKLVDQVLKDTANGPERVYKVQEIVCNLATSCQNILEPYLDVLPGGIAGYGKQWKISSGYRLKGVVKTESPTSDHCKGHCFDIALLLPDRFNKTYQLVQQLEKLINYDQIILEYRYKDQVWIHTGYKATGNRKMAFTMVNDKVYQRDSKGMPSGFVLLDNGAPPQEKK